MSLAEFSIIVTVDGGNGISKDGGIPWKNSEVEKFFRETTIGKGKNVVIMGRGTYEAIPLEFRPLAQRRTVVVSRTLETSKNPKITIYTSLGDALAGLGGMLKNIEDIYILGGEGLFNEAIREYSYLCKKIIVTKLKMDYNCEQMFPFDEIKDLPKQCEPLKSSTYTRYIFTPQNIHPEREYTDLLLDLVKNGEFRPDSTNIGRMYLFGRVLQFDLSERMPFITTRKINYENMIAEILFILTGSTNADNIGKKGVYPWLTISSKNNNEARKLSYYQGDTGPNIGWFLRHWGEIYTDNTIEYSGFDQLENLIEILRTNPLAENNRLTLYCHDPNYSPKMLFDSGLRSIQFSVSAEKKYLDMLVYIEDCNAFSDLPNFIGMLAVLSRITAQLTSLSSRHLKICLGSTWIPNNMGEQVRRQINRTPRPFPVMYFRDMGRVHRYSDFATSNILIEGYNSWPAISEPV